MQRHRVDERVVAVVAVIGAAMAALAGAEPTGSRVVDTAIVLLAVGAIVWASASAPWWTISLAAGGALVMSTTWWSAALAAAAAAASWWIGAQRRDLATGRALVVAVACNLVIRSGVDGFHGLSTLVGVAVVVPAAALGLRRRRSSASRGVFVGVAAVGALAVLSTLAMYIGARGTQDDIEIGIAHANTGIAAVGRGEFLEASSSFAAASESFAEARDVLDSPWTVPGRAVPVVAQNHRAVADLSDRAASASAALAAALAVVDPDQLRLEAGGVDLDVIEILQQPFAAISTEFDALSAAVDAIDSPWLIEPVATRLTELRDDLDQNRPGLDAAVLALDLAPRLLGADGERHYFIAITSPAEARGLAGFMGNWIELTASEGRLWVSASGRTLDLNRSGGDDRWVTGPADWIEQYGRFGFTSGPAGRTESDPWSNVTLSPHFPSTAEVIAELYPQSGGRDVDGVFSIDPEVVKVLLGYVGAITVDEPPTSLTSANVVDFLLVDQYATNDDPQRVDLLQEVSEEAVERALAGALPNPAILARDLGPLARAGHLSGWARDVEEQDLFRSIGLAGELPALDGGDGFGVVFTNAGANKLDAYLERSVSYRARVGESGEVESTLVVTVTNDAPTTGFPDGVIGNYTGDPVGTNRTRLSLFSALPVLAADAGGTPVEPRTGSEQGWTVNSIMLAIAPGSTIEVTFTLAGAVGASADGYRLVTFVQPLANALTSAVTATDEQGAELFFRAGVTAGVETFDAGRSGS